MESSQINERGECLVRDKKKYKATTNSEHSKPLYNNELEQNFTVGSHNKPLYNNELEQSVTVGRHTKRLSLILLIF